MSRHIIESAILTAGRTAKGPSAERTESRCSSRAVGLMPKSMLMAEITTHCASAAKLGNLLELLLLPSC